MSHDDHHLIQAFLKGDSHAMRSLDSWIIAATGGFRLRLHHGWDDLLQDIRADLLQRFRAAEFRGEAGLKTYVWRVAVHAAITRVRRESYRCHPPLESAPTPVAAEESALDRVLRREEGLAALRILDETTGQCRELFRHVLAGRSYSQLSRETGESEVALRVRLLRCRQQAQRLRERLLFTSPQPAPSKPR